MAYNYSEVLASRPIPVGRKSKGTCYPVPEGEPHQYVGGLGSTTDPWTQSAGS